MDDAETRVESGHTPGPWRHDPASSNPNGYAIYGSNAQGGQVLPIVAMTYNWPRRAEANARLIAAAPEMLAALNDTVAFIRIICGNVDEIANALLVNAEAALAKATTPVPAQRGGA